MNMKAIGIYNRDAAKSGGVREPSRSKWCSRSYLNLIDNGEKKVERGESSREREENLPKPPKQLKKWGWSPRAKGSMTRREWRSGRRTTMQDLVGHVRGIKEYVCRGGVFFLFSFFLKEWQVSLKITSGTEIQMRCWYLLSILVSAHSFQGVLSCTAKDSSHKCPQ